MSNNVPKLRFKGFNDEWRKKHFNNIVERVIRKNKNNISKRPLTISAQYGLVDQEKFFNKIVASKNMEGYYLLNNGEFAYNKSYSNGYPFGAIKRLDKYENGAVSTLYICFKNREKIDSNYLVQYFESGKWNKEVSMIAVEGARNHGLLNIGVSDFFDTIHLIPEVEEQKRIANFLTKVDEIMEKQEEKVSNLENYKKGMMQKIFSQEIRFKDENGEEYPEWNNGLLGEVVIFTNGKGHEQIIDDLGEYIVINSKFVSTEGKVIKKSILNLCPLEKNDIALVMSDVPNGKALSKCYYIEEDNKYTLNQRVCGLKIIENNNSKYIFYFINRNRYFLEFDNGVGQTNLRKEEVLGCPIKLPCLEEQTRIANFLSNIDSIVEKEKQKSEKLKLWKKGLLQQMFV